MAADARRASPLKRSPHARVLLVVALVHVVSGVVVLFLLRSAPRTVDEVRAELLMLIPGLLAVYPAADMLVRGRRPAVLAGAGLVAAAGLGLVVGPPWPPSAGWDASGLTRVAMDALPWAMFTLPPAVLAAARGPLRRLRPPLLVQGAAAAAFLALAASRAPFATGDAAWRVLGEAAAQLAFGAALLAAVLARDATREFPRPLRAGAFRASGAWTAGLVTVAASWAVDGTAMLLPFWLLALGFLAVPPLARARAHAWGAGVIVLLLLVGAPEVVGPCTADVSTDVPESDPPSADVRVRLMDLALRGPTGWYDGGGLGGTRYTCPPAAGVAAMAWLGALVVAAAWRPTRAEPLEGP